MVGKHGEIRIMIMKNKLIFIYCFLSSFIIYSQNNILDVYNFDIFGFKFKYSIDDVKKELIKQKKEFNAFNDHYITNENIKFINIAPGKGGYYDYLKEDFVFIFYETELYVIKFTKVVEKDYNIIIDKLKTNFKTITTNKESNNDVIYLDNKIKVIIYPLFSNEGYEIVFLNIEVGNKVRLNVNKEESPDCIYYKSRTLELPLREGPNIDEKTIYYISKNDKFTIFKEADYDKKNNGKWVFIEINDFISGWVLDSYIIKEKDYVNSIKYIPKVDNLRLRESPSIDGKIIRLLTKNEKLEFMERGKEETINGIKGYWINIKTEKGETGWCFDGYLNIIKDNTSD
jgi:hypothetical protein